MVRQGGGRFSGGNAMGCILIPSMRKSRKAYEGFWDLDFLKIETIYPPNENKECDSSNYPDCNSITLIEKEEFGSPEEVIVLLCYWNNEKGGYKKCEIGKIYASGKAIK